MTSRFSVAIGALVFLLSGLIGQAWAQADLKPNPMIEELLRKAPDGEAIVELKGYVGPSAADTLRLYESMGLNRYYDIPKSAVVGSAPEGDPTAGLVKVFVRGSAIIVVSNRIPAGALTLASARASKLGILREAGGPCDDLCHQCVLQGLNPSPVGVDIYCSACIICYATH